MKPIWGMILASAIALPASKVTAQSTRPDSDISRWLSDLNADDWHLREQAESELIKYGPDASPAVEALLKATHDPEVQERGHQILRRIGSYVYPAFVTLHLHAAPAKQAFAAIAAAAHVFLPAESEHLWDLPLPTVTLDAYRQPFWTVVVQACRQTHLTVILDTADMRTVELAQGDIGDPCDQNAILGLTPRTYLMFDSTTVNLKFPMMAEPDVRVLSFPIRDSDENELWTFEEAVDTSNQDHIFESPSATEGSREGHWVMALLHIGTGPRVLSELKLKAAVIVQTSSAKLEVDDFAHMTQASSTDDGLTITAVRRPTPQAGTWEVEVTVQASDFSQEQADLIDRYFKDSTRLLDAEGRPFIPISSTLSMSSGRVMRQIIFSRYGLGLSEPAGEPSRLLVEIPTSARQESVPMEWRNVSLTGKN
ncbi:MAG TPA: hypothetical protein VMD30_11255 [Tepidisphaeraceae bacterium]|nr:hypothetical protein [Tepidisphaeraceae bacterium]